jgi:predicted TIM-barrel fold metal-dependent hydrolase
MELLDVQVHPVFRAGEVERLGQEEALARAAERTIAAMDAVGVDGAMVVNTSPDMTDIMSFLEWFPDRFCGGVNLWPLPVDRPAEDVIAEIAATPGVVGARLVPAHPRDPEEIERFRAGLYEPFFMAAERHDLPLFLLVDGHTSELHPVLRSHPGLTVVIDHLGLPIPPYHPVGPALFDSLDEVMELAQFPNVAIKLSGGQALSVEGFPFADVWCHGRRLIDAFGADRVIWGSDYTRVAHLCTYRDAVDFILHADAVVDHEREQICAGSLRKWFRWDTVRTSGAMSSALK